MERLYKKLDEYGRKDYYPFHMPGHKRNPLSVDGNFPLDRDITEIDGFDDLHHPEGIIRDAQESLARLYGTQKSFFSVNGSTAAILSAISACVSQGGHILVARNCHKSVYHGIYIRNLVPFYVYPQSDSELGINGGISPSRVERCLEENSDIQAMFITSPTYDGVVSDVEKLAEIAHKYEIPLIVDEAHGAHFRFSKYFPRSAVDMGADIVIQSFHKTLPSMTQTAVLHVCSDRVDKNRIRRFMGIYQSSSPSYILMSSLDACIDKLERDGIQMFKKFTENLSETRMRLSQCRYIRLMPSVGEESMFKGRVAAEQEMYDAADGKWENVFDSSRPYDFDRSKLILTTNHSSLNGKELAGILREEFHIEVEMTTENYVLALSSVGDTKEGFQRLIEAVESIDKREALKIEGSNGINTDKADPVKKNNKTDSVAAGKDCGKMKQVMTISQAMDAPQLPCLLEESVGKISAEFVYLYPPGIPIIVPGEQITGQFTRNVRRYLEQGLNLQGLLDNKAGIVCVVKEQG